MQLMFTLLCFAGLAFMFFCVQRQQEKMFKLMQDEHAQIRTLLRAIEARMDNVEEEALNLPPETPESQGVRVASATFEAPDMDMALQPGATVAQATEMLRAAEGLRSLDLESDKGRVRSSKRMPDLKL